MPRPSTKKHLVELAESEFAALDKIIAALPAVGEHPEGTPEDWAPADFLAHLWEWQHMFFTWYEGGCRGENTPTPAPGYKWSQLPALNLAIFHKHHGRPFDQILTDLRDSHRRLMDLAARLSDEELFTPGKYSWTRSNNLAAYMISAGSSHYLWARKEIQKAVKRAT